MKSNINNTCRAGRLLLGSLVCVYVASSVAWAEQGVSAKTAAMKSRSQSPPVVPAASTQGARGNALAAVEPQGNAPAPAQQPKVPLPDTKTQLGPSMDALLGKATLLRLPQAVERISVANPTIADVTLISLREVYVLGKDLGTTNIIVWTQGGQATIVDVNVSADPALLEQELRAMLPSETDIRVKTTADSLVLLGSVSDALKADYAVQIAQAWIRRLTRGLVAPIALGDGTGGTRVSITETQNTLATVATAGPRVVNMLSVRAPQQVMLQVKVAEVSKTLLDKLGVSIGQHHSWGGANYSLLSTSDFFGQLLGLARVATSAANFGQIDAQRDDGLIKLLAEPNLMAISGQEASFNAGGKIFIPVARNNDTGGTTITLEEKEFGVGVKFKPTVLEGGRINLQIASRVSEPQQSGNPFTSVNGINAILPSFTERRAETTVQLHDGQSFMIAGLIKNNVSETIKRFPGLGDIPVLGVLFRSSQFQREKSELMFVITPRLVQPLPPNYTVPTDNYVEPSRKEYFLEGKTEGTKAGGDSQPASITKSGAAEKQSGGFEMK
jgi:pilus assembly protein CpaC